MPGETHDAWRHRWMDVFLSVPLSPTARRSHRGRVALTDEGDVKRRLVDLFSGAGGAAAGYKRAGFHVVGVDINPQPHYAGDEFIQADALTFPLNGFDAIHASAPCQFATAYRRRQGHVHYSANLIPATRWRLQDTGLPYVIENVPTARRELIDPIQLCGSAFGLDVRRHRLFESNVSLTAPACRHDLQTPRFPPATNRTNLRRTVEVGVWRIPLDVQQRAMGIDWMTLTELSQAIPPAYTCHLGAQLLTHLEAAAPWPTPDDITEDVA